MIGIIDYGLGNLKAFANVFGRLAFPHFFVRLPDEVRKAGKLILPGVGSFDQAMIMLNASGLRPEIEAAVLERGVPVLGVCVGMQMLAKSSDEGKEPGLGWIGGRVKHLSGIATDPALVLPHMGWNSVEVTQPLPLFEGLESQVEFYFLHSYYFECESESEILATVSYGQRFACAVRRDNVFGVQFHPEKSHHSGIGILKNFGRM